MNMTAYSRTQFIFWSAFLSILLIPLIGSALSPLSFSLFVPLAGVPFFFAHKFLFGTWPLVRAPFPALLPLMLLLFALMIASSWWSVTPEATLSRAEKIIGLMVGGFALIGVAQACPREIWQKFNLLFPLAVFVVGMITIIDISTDMTIFRIFNDRPEIEIRPDAINKNASVFVMSLPLMLYLSMKGRSVLFTSALFALTALLFFVTSSQACQLSLLVLMLAAIGCLFFLEKMTIRAALLSLTFVFLMLPWIAPTAFDLVAAHVAQKDSLMDKASMALRLENWDFLSRRILENPLNGFGMDTTRAMTFDTQKLYFKNDSIMHPHNAALQMWIEFGVFGIIWSLAFFGYFYALLMKLPAAQRRLSFLTFCGIIVFLMVSWSIWSSWLVAFIFYLAGLCVLAAKTSTGPATA